MDGLGRIGGFYVGLVGWVGFGFGESFGFYFEFEFKFDFDF